MLSQVSVKIRGTVSGPMFLLTRPKSLVQNNVIEFKKKKRNTKENDRKENLATIR